MGATISYAVYAPGIFMHLKFKEKLVNIVLGKKLKFVLEIQSLFFFKIHLDASKVQGKACKHFSRKEIKVCA